ncbi:hypothetical protein [Pararhodobacter oceanensis]|uniref:hypothetical protein n=1 Tax=Pararhodobacter oceanensis TaxID=2172121 RepID=UPI003A8CFB01
MRLISLAAAATAVTLAGCVDVDMTTTITGADSATLTGFMEVETEILNMMGGAESFCDAEEGGTLEMTDTVARCNMLVEGSFAEVFEGEPGEPVPTATDLGDGTVRIEFPLGEMTAETGEMREDPQAAAMMRPMLEGHSFTMRVAGAEIISTNGTLSDDGQSAYFTFPLVDVLSEDFSVPDVFEAVVRY